MEINEKARVGSARKLARMVLKKSKINEPPVNLREVINYLKKDHNLEIHFQSDFTDKISGFLVTIEDKYLDKRTDEIHINKNHHWHRRRFTIAHEIGHLLMNTSCKSFDESLSDNDFAEVEANQFASELLIPLAMINKDLKKGGVTVDDLADKYIVSKEAMGWKICNCNLLGKI